MRWNLRRVISNRRTLFVAVIGLTILTIAIVETVTVSTTRNQLLMRTDSGLRAQVETTQIALNVLTPKMLADLTRMGRVLEQNNAIVVINGQGKVVNDLPIRSNGSGDASPVLPDRATLQARFGKPFNADGSGSVRHFRVITQNLGHGNIIVYGAPLNTVDGTLADLRRDALLVGALAIVLLSFILWRLLAAATRPIDSMIDVAARIGDGDFAARVEPDAIHGDAARLGTALNQMVARIERAFAETSASEATLRRFVADASHELRTPLTSIRGYAQLLRKGAAGDEAETAMTRIDSEATRMAALVDDLLLLARLDQGRPLARGPVDVTALVRELAADERLLEPQRPLTLDVPDEPARVIGDEDRLRQLLTNLLGNIRTHTPADTRVVLSVRTTGSDVAITVSDDGPGMADNDAARAFDRFYRADMSRNRDSGGSGLGLAIARAIVEAHSGTIELTTATGKGTAVYVRLPGALVLQPDPAPNARAGSEPALYDAP